MSFRLVIVVSRNPINLINLHFLHQQPARLKIRIEKVEWISAHNYDKPKWHSFTPSLAEKGKYWTSILSYKLCHRKQTTEQNR